MNRVKFKAGKHLCVKWEDSATEIASTDWTPGKKLRDALRRNAGVVNCYTSGFVVATNHRCLTLAQSVSNSGQVSHVIHIPWAAIQWIRPLKEGKKVKPKP